MNACTAVGEKLKYENLDLYLQVIRSMHGARGHGLKLWKADIDSAFRRATAREGRMPSCVPLLRRRIPLLPEHRQYAHIAFRRHGQVFVSKHLACMFGAVSSVHHWERVGALLIAQHNAPCKLRAPLQDNC